MKFQEWFDLTIDQCIQNNATECDFTGDKVPYRELQLTFFCGNIPECRRVGSRDALAQVRKKLFSANSMGQPQACLFVGHDEC